MDKLTLIGFKNNRRIRGNGCAEAAASLFILTLVAFLLFCPQKASAYILSTEQILDLMAKNFAPFKTVSLTRTVYLAEGEGREIPLEEVIYLKSPGFYGRQSETGERPTDIHYMALLMPLSVSSLTGHLTRLGINTNERAFVLQDRVICYRIGGKTNDAPVLLVEKQRCIPILLRTKPPSSATSLRVISFKDYRQIDEDWYPFETIISEDGKIIVRCVVKEIKVNPAIPPGLSFTPIDAVEGAGPSPFQETIKVLREKYR